MPVYKMRSPRWGLSRARAFEAQGVILKFPARSTSGVRDYDGVVVFAIRAADVRVDECGSSCLLWAPDGAAAEGAIGRASSEERLEHCRLAVRHGGAEGFLVDRANAPLDGHEMFSLRVVRAGEKYWARWGSVVRAEGPRQCAVAMGAQL